MASPRIEQQIESLDRRVTALERLSPRRAASRAGNWLSTGLAELTGEAFGRTVGWFLLTVSSLALFSSWMASEQYNPYLAIIFFLALWLICRNSSLFDHSDSTLQILHEGRTQRRLQAKEVHHSAKPRTPDAPLHEMILDLFRDGLFVLGAILLAASYGWAVNQYVADPAWQVFLLVGLVVLAMGYGFARRSQALLTIAALAAFSILAVGDAPLFAVLAGQLVAAAFTYICWRDGRWSLLFLVVLLDYAMVARFASLLLTSDYVGRFGMERAVYLGEAVGMSLLAALIIFFLPFLRRRREAGERETIRAIMLGNAVAFSVVSLWLLADGNLDGWTLTHFVTLIVTSCLGYVAWLAHGRLSYAKYFFAISLLAIAGVILLQPNRTLVDVLWFIVGVILLSGGFMVGSYTLRIFGLGALMLSLAIYFLQILPDMVITGDPAFVIDATWLGAMLGVFLMVLGTWYRDLKTRGNEALYLPVIVQGCYTLAVLIALAWMHGGSAGFLRSVLWILLGICVAWFARRQRFAFLQALGLALSLAGIAKLALVDIAGLNDISRISLALVLALVFLGGGYLLARFPRNVLRYIA